MSTTGGRPAYLGRFAPSPTGPLHFGSLLAALGSWLEARRNNGAWHVRIDDIDPQREQPGAREAIPRTLARFGLEPDAPVSHQSDRCSRYLEALEALHRSGSAFPCACTRKQVRRDGHPGINGPVYPGTCRAGLPQGAEPRTWRARAVGRIRFRDDLQGDVDCRLEEAIGDFIIRRADGWPAYHLAAAVDDGLGAITHVVRGHDLLPCTPPQHFLIEALGGTPPAYAHLPVALDRHGQKLSKQTFARALDARNPAPQLHAALSCLAHPPPAELLGAPVDRILAWAQAHWMPERLEGVQSCRAPEESTA